MPLTMLLGALVLLRRSLRDLDAIVPKLRDVGVWGAQTRSVRRSRRSDCTICRRNRVCAIHTRLRSGSGALGACSSQGRVGGRRLTSRGISRLALVSSRPPSNRA